MTFRRRRNVLSRIVEAARTDVPDSRELELALRPLLPPGAKPRFEDASTAAKATLVKVATSCLVVIAITSGAVVAATSSRSIGRAPGAESAPRMIQASAAHENAALPPSPESADSVASPAVANPAVRRSPGARATLALPDRARAATTPHVVVPLSPNPTPASASFDDPGADSEAALIEEARKTLHADPARTLSLTLEHARIFPSGLLGLEREALAIHALALLGRDTEARARLRTLEERHPRSIHVTRLHRVLGDDDSTTDQ